MTSEDDVKILAVTPAKAGVQGPGVITWISGFPPFAGMTGISAFFQPAI